jgi:hypothetical protein
VLVLPLDVPAPLFGLGEDRSVLNELLDFLREVFQLIAVHGLRCPLLRNCSLIAVFCSWFPEATVLLHFADALPLLIPDRHILAFLSLFLRGFALVVDLLLLPRTGE